jgi:hypothetical protein
MKFTKFILEKTSKAAACIKQKYFVRSVYGFHMYVYIYLFLYIHV